ncbi:hypothetical protein ACJQWK_02802 [Exserohilum turcicum]
MFLLSAHLLPNRSPRPSRPDAYAMAPCRVAAPDADVLLDTQEKPYPCRICGKSFARADLVKRHATQHVPKASRPRLADSQSRSGSRVDQACRACAASKLKCSEAKPCQRCIRRNIMCEYESTSNATPKYASDHPNPSNVLINGQPLNSATVELDVAPMSPMSVPEPSQPPTTTHESAGLAHNVYATDSVSTFSLMDTPSANSGPAGDGHAHSASQSNMLPSFEHNSSTNQSGFWPDEVTRNYSEVLKDLLGSTMASPVAFDGFSQTDKTFWDAFMEGDEQFIDINDIPLLDLQPCTMDSADARAPKPRGDERDSSFDCVASAAASQAFRSSGWDWGPTRGDSTSAEITNLILPSACKPDTTGVHAQRHMPPILGSEDRDRLLSLLLHHCIKEQWIRIAPKFPSELFLDQILRQFFASQRLETVPWFHIPSFRPDLLRDELLAAIVGIGASFTRHEPVQRFGYAMPEILRNAVIECWTTDNTTSRDIQLLQAWLTQAELSSWSGNKRQMEIGESNYQQAVTIIRRARWLRRDQYRVIRPEPSDEGEALERKWNGWVTQETRKR